MQQEHHIATRQDRTGRRSRAPQPPPHRRRHPERSEGPLYFAFAVAVVFCLAVTPSASDAQTIQRPDLDRLRDIKTRQCNREEGQLSTSAEAISLLTVYGYSKDIRWMCESTSVSWLPTATIIQLHGVTAAVDSNTYVTLVRARTGARLWLIPAINGMVTYAGIWDDPHNRAVLNDLFRISSYKPKSSEEWTQLSLLYLYMTGWQIRLDDYSWAGEQRHGLKSHKGQLTRLKLLPSVEPDKEGVDVTVNELAADDQYFVWDLCFSSVGNEVLLTSATREQHKIGEQEN